MKVGDKVYWGPYGDFDDPRVFIIKDITENDPMFNCRTYLIQTSDGNNTAFAFQDEIMPIIEH